MNIILTGSTGMVGKGVLLECLDSPAIQKVLAINRSTLNMDHPKLQEVLLPDFSRLEEIREQLAGYDACFHCMGVSALGLSEAEYTHITYTYTQILADLLYELNPQMVFVYVSGAGTDSSEQGRSMWARVKGRTENMLFQKGFRDAYAFRPGFIVPERGIKSRTGWYNTVYAILRPFFPLLKKSKHVTTTSRLGQAMINVLAHPQQLKLLENVHINALAEKTPPK